MYLLTFPFLELNIGESRKLEIGIFSLTNDAIKIILGSILMHTRRIYSWASTISFETVEKEAPPTSG
jgi:hypothetical protein